MAEIAHSQRLLRVRLVCRGCKCRPFSHANSPRLSIVCVYTWRFWPIVSAFVFSQRQLSLSASMHNTPGAKTINVFRACLGAQLTICAQKWRSFVLFSMVSLKFVLSRVCVFLYSLGPRCVAGVNFVGLVTRIVRDFQLSCVYAWRFWPIVSAFVFSQRQLSLSASMHNTPAWAGPGPQIIFAGRVWA